MRNAYDAHEALIARADSIKARDKARKAARNFKAQQRATEWQTRALATAGAVVAHLLSKGR